MALRRGFRGIKHSRSPGRSAPYEVTGAGEVVKGSDRGAVLGRLQPGSGRRIMGYELRLAMPD